MLVPESFMIYEFAKPQADSPISSNGTAQYSIIGENQRFTILNIVYFIDLFEDNLIQCPIRDNRYRSPSFSISNRNCFSILNQ